MANSIDTVFAVLIQGIYGAYKSYLGNSLSRPDTIFCYSAEEERRAALLRIRLRGNVLEGSYHSVKVFAWLCEFYTDTIQTAPNDFSRDLNCFF